MLDHITLAVRDYEKAKKFFTAALKPLGYEIAMDFKGTCGLGVAGKPDFWITAADANRPVAAMHVAFTAPNRKAVDAFYQAAISAGAKDNGAPGVRADYHPNYYGAFVIDDDGHNVEAVCHKPT